MRISTRHQSPCCEASTILKSVLENGLIGRYCEECGKYKGLLSKAEFLTEMNWSAYPCPDCEAKLRPDIRGYNDYFLVCDHCPVGVKLADLIPRAPETEYQLRKQQEKKKLVSRANAALRARERS